MLCFSSTQPYLFVSSRRGALRDDKENCCQRPVGTLGQIYLFDENSTQKETMKPLFYSRKRSKKIELRVITVSEQRIRASH